MEGDADLDAEQTSSNLSAFAMFDRDIIDADIKDIHWIARQEGK